MLLQIRRYFTAFVVERRSKKGSGWELFFKIYSMVAMTLLAHEMPLPEGVKPPLAKRG